MFIIIELKKVTLRKWTFIIIYLLSSYPSWLAVFGPARSSSPVTRFAEGEEGEGEEDSKVHGNPWNTEPPEVHRRINVFRDLSRFKCKNVKGESSKHDQTEIRQGFVQAFQLLMTCWKLQGEEVNLKKWALHCLYFPRMWPSTHFGSSEAHHREKHF